MTFNAPTSRPTYGRCDSFFIESESDVWYERKQVEREQARQLARVRQQSLAGELSRRTSEEYQDDILDQMEYMEAS